MKIRAVTLCLMLFTATAAWAQDDVDYNFEIGVTAGTSFYNGDLNHKFFGQPGFAGGITGRPPQGRTPLYLYLHRLFGIIKSLIVGHYAICRREVSHAEK